MEMEGKTLSFDSWNPFSLRSALASLHTTGARQRPCWPMTDMHEFTLIQELDELFRQDPDIEELGIIFSIPPPIPTPAPPDSAGGLQPPSPAAAVAAATAAAAAAAAEPQFILQDHKLGVSVHSVHPLINEARAEFPAARRDYHRLRQAYLEEGHRDDPSEEIGQGKEEDVGDCCASEEVVTAAERLLSVTRSLLLVNADHGSAWNARKELVLDGLCGGACVSHEIKLLNLIFTKHAKSPNAWAHRRWCWRNNDNNDDADDGRSGQQRRRRRQRHPTKDGSWQPLDLEDELRVCQRVAEIYPKNYYAWTQRSWVVLRAVGAAKAAIGAGAEENARQGTTSTTPTAKELLQREISFVDKWLTSHVSDHSGLNHRKNIFSALAALSPASPHETRLDLVEKERSANSELLKDYPGHESLWCYRRFVCQALLVTAPHGTLVGKTTGATKETDAEQPPSSLTSCSSSKGHYDWAGWGRAVEEWHDRCVREDVKAAVVHDSDEEEEEEEAGGVEGSQDKGADFEAAEGALPGSPAGTGLLATFLGQEARFALDCATDKGAWQFEQQRRHALAHLAFVSYAADRIISGDYHEEVHRENEEGGRGSEEAAPTHRPSESASKSATAGDLGGGEGPVAGKRTAAGGRCLTYCEVTGAPKLTFPLSSCTVGGGRHPDVDDDGGVSAEEDAREACRGLNAYVTGLAKADAIKAIGEGGGSGCGGVAPYAIRVRV